VQLQQVAMNLIVNSIEAMKDVDGIREMVIRSQRAENEQILVSIRDTGVGIPPQLAEQIFDSLFYNESPRHWHGTSHLPVNCRSSWWSLVGGRLKRARSDTSFKPTRRDFQPQIDSAYSSPRIEAQTPNSYSRRYCLKSSTLSFMVSQLRFLGPFLEG
jgi:DNA topoisomerase VI subunit B